MALRVMLLPGGVMPGSLAYATLLPELGDDVDAVVKELEVYAGDAPPSGYGLETEIAGIARTADEHGFDRFHLVGYSAGGACSLAFTAAHPERVLSLALMEPAWAGNERTPREQALWQRFIALGDLPPEQRMPGFIALHLAPGVEPPPQPGGPPPPWMAKRPAGLDALMAALQAADIDLAALRAFDRPVYFALGARSNPDYFAAMGERLGDVFPDFTVETFPERHHFDPPHRVEPQRVAAALRALWERARPAPGPPSG